MVRVKWKGKWRYLIDFEKAKTDFYDILNLDKKSRLALKLYRQIKGEYNAKN